MWIRRDRPFPGGNRRGKATKYARGFCNKYANNNLALKRTSISNNVQPGIWQMRHIIAYTMWQAHIVDPQKCINSLVKRSLVAIRVENRNAIQWHINDRTFGAVFWCNFSHGMLFGIVQFRIHSEPRQKKKQFPVGRNYLADMHAQWANTPIALYCSFSFRTWVCVAFSHLPLCRLNGVAIVATKHLRVAFWGHALTMPHHMHIEPVWA